MNTFTRRSTILESIERDGVVNLRALSHELGVAPVTIHRDLEHLEQIGAVERIRGGARKREAANHSVHAEFSLRLNESAEAKTAMAEHARDSIPEGSTIFLDSSTTCLALARVLQQRPPAALTLVTNSPAILYEMNTSNIHVIATPGEINQPMKCISGRWTVEFLEQLSFSAAFLSAAGIMVDRGLLTGYRELADIASAVLNRADKRVALVDATKFGGQALIQLATHDQIDVVVTDDRLTAETRDKYKHAGWTIEIALSGKDK
ncbi:DeoR/GlpR family DNA-binding transcription regulator [Arthrobacter sp. NPDC080031]|uniref:DeoR/GlpR family DNA-binding transcription regulator n=1 Tax=Arthrobacter sp. NPDC080031 TaxID=3155918 RepID=UPI00344F590F